MLSSSTKVHWRVVLLTLAVTAVICHGSLYPYEFQPHGGVRAAVDALLASWKTPPTGFADGIANVCLYMPLGFAGVLALGNRHRLAAITLFGLLVCTAIEIAQFFDLGRFTNMSDVYCNTTGTFLGALAGTEFAARFRNRPGVLTVEAVPAVLLAVLLAYRLYPYVPTIDLHKYWHSVTGMLLHPGVSPWNVFQYFALWLTTSYLIDAALPGSPRLIIPCFAAVVFAAKIVIVDQTLGASELTGAAIAVFFWLAFLERSRVSSLIVAASLGMMIVVFRLQPFAFHAAPVTSFGWVPFRSIVVSSISGAFVAFGEKIFLYASLLWIASRAGLSLWTSTIATALLLLITSLAETYIPGRSAEITDAVMALFLGAGIGALDRAAALATNGTKRPTGRRNRLLEGSRLTP